MDPDSLCERMHTRNFYTEQLTLVDGTVLSADEQKIWVNKGVMLMALEVIRHQQRHSSTEYLYNYAKVILSLFLEDKTDTLVNGFILYNQVVDMEYEGDD